jgi:hypothetical protein
VRANQIQPPWRFDDPHVIRRGCDYETGYPMDPERRCNDYGTALGRWVGPQSYWPQTDALGG